MHTSVKLILKKYDITEREGGPISYCQYIPHMTYVLIHINCLTVRWNTISIPIGQTETKWFVQTHAAGDEWSRAVVLKGCCPWTSRSSSNTCKCVRRENSQAQPRLAESDLALWFNLRVNHLPQRFSCTRTFEHHPAKGMNSVTCCDLD